MSDSTNGPSMEDEQEWLATQYVLGDLSAVEAELFEAAMLEDSSLCEMVAEACLLISGIQTSQTASPALAVVPVSRGLQERANWSVGMALVVALVFAATLSLRTSPVSSETGWTSAEVDVLTTSGISFVADVGESELDLVPIEHDPHDRLVSLDAPEWLMTAVELEKDLNSHDHEDESDVF
ncbi:MAG: hypothetical protein ACK58L_04275 [Planctomycetota bacterium]